MFSRLSNNIFAVLSGSFSVLLLYDLSERTEQRSREINYTNHGCAWLDCICICSTVGRSLACTHTITPDSAFISNVSIELFPHRVRNPPPKLEASQVKPSQTNLNLCILLLHFK